MDLERRGHYDADGDPIDLWKWAVLTVPACWSSTASSPRTRVGDDV